MKYDKYLKIILLLIAVLSLTTLRAYSKEKAQIYEKVTFIYIHGANEHDEEDFDDEIDDLHECFANKKLGDHKISPKYERVFWGKLPEADRPAQLNEDGLMKINTAHNFFPEKRTSKPKLLLLLNPANRIYTFMDNGSSPNAIYLRNLINNYMYDLVWVCNDNSHLNEVFDIIQDKINHSNGKFVLVGHSLGSLIAVDFIINRILLDPSNPNFNKSNYDNFTGLITSGDINNVFNASVWLEQVKSENFEQNKNNFIRYIVKNDKFWISYNHHNDILATCLAGKITSYNKEGPGFILSAVYRTDFVNKVMDFFEFWDYSDSEIMAHDWMYNSPKVFAKLVLKTYNNKKHVRRTILHKL